MDLALIRARPGATWQTAGFAVGGGLLGFLAWSGASADLALALLMPALWGLAPNRIAAGLCAFGYYAAASHGVSVGAEVFFQNGLGYAMALWIGASALSTLPWFLLFSRRQRALRAALAMVLVAIPPIGIVGWAHPITAAGELVPGGAWLGLAATCVGLSLSARWPLLAVAMVIVALVMPQASIEAPDGWRGVQTHLLMTSGQHRLLEQHERLVTLAEQVSANDTDRVLIFPETILGQWQAPSSWLWADAARQAHTRGQTLVFGAEWPRDDGHYENIAGVMDRHGDLSPIYRQLMPVPFSMWRPWAGEGAVPAWIEPQTAMIDGLEAAFLICYEQLLIWPPLVALATDPDVLVGMSNDWWARDTNIPAIQRAAMAAWARLFAVPLVLSENL
ncbi:MAG: nitrilase-related carbon-nitrogen hydrolase [Sedimenticolaceae bacterium]|nr:nitrilase-related carbon-nitrogen hydrolase [Gammaproteobacteria bacterium]